MMNKLNEYILSLLTTGQGVFETMLFSDGILWFKELHLKRLKKTARFFNINPDWNKIDDELNVHLKALRSSSEKRIKIKLILLFPFTSVTVPSVESLILSNPLPDNESSLGGIKLHLAKSSISPLSGIKSLNFGPSLYKVKEARKKGFDDVLFYNGKKNILETSVANFFAFKNGRLITPPLRSGILPGIIRKILIMHFNAVEQPIKLKDLPQLESPFITNSLKELMPVKKIDQINYENPGILFGKLMTEWNVIKSKYRTSSSYLR